MSDYSKVFTDPYDLKEHFTKKSYPSREKWLSGREKGIGASESAIVMGMNPFSNNQDLFDYKINHDCKPDIQNEAMDYGLKAEAPLRELFAITYPRYHVSYIPNTTLKSKKKKFMLYSPDGLLYDVDTDQFGLYEGKTAAINNRVAELAWDNRIPDHYFVQILHGLFVTNFQFAIVNAELRRTRQTVNGEIYTFERRMYRYDRNVYEKDIEQVVNESKKFWEYVKKQERPPLVINF